MEKPRGISTIVIAVVLLIIIIAGVGGYYYLYLPTTKPLVPNPDTLVYQTHGDADYLDPAVDYETFGGMIIENTYETLVTYKGESMTDFVPQLAESYTVSTNGLVYTFKLRQGIKFHDGTPFNAAAVKYSIDRVILINDPDGPGWILSQSIKGGPEYSAANTWQVENKTEVAKYLAAGGVKVIDEYTVQFTLDHPYAAFVSTLAFTAASIVSPTAVEAHGGVKPGFHNEWMDKHAEAGTGPYKVVDWTPKQRIVLERNENYWGEKPKLKRFIIQEIDEVGTRELALFAGDADVVTIGAANMFDIVDKDAWLKDQKLVPLKKGITVLAYPSITISPVFQMNLKLKPFDNKDFRYAMRYAFDYKTFTDTVINGFGIRARSGIPKGLLGYDERIPLVEYDPVKAKEYFLKAKTAGAYKDGDTVTMYYNTGNEPRRRGCLLFKDAIEKLGVGLKINVQELDWPTFLAKIRTKELPIFFVGWAPDYADPDDYAIPFYDGRKGTYAIRVGYNNDTINKLIDQASTELDPKKRAELYLEIQREVNEEAVYIWTVQPMYTFVMRDWVKGFQCNAALATCSDGLGLYRLMWKEERTEQVTV